MNNDQLQQKDIEMLRQAHAEIKQEMRTGFSRIESKLELMSRFMTREEIEAQLDKKASDKELQELKNSHTWLYRTVAAAIITAIITGIFISK